MADTRYGFVDDGDVVLARPSNNIYITNGSDCCNEAMSKIEEITKDAPKEMDTFSEVADMIESLSKKVERLESTDGSNVDLSEYAKKSDLCKYVTRDEATTYMTKIDFASEIAKLDNKYLRKDEIPQMDGYVKHEELEEELNGYIKSDELNSKVMEAIKEVYEPIDASEIDRIFNE